MTEFTMSMYRSQADLYAAMNAHIRQLEEALRFYAENSTLWSAMDKDDGKTARRALGESK